VICIPPRKLLLTSVFAPYGVSDGYAEPLGMQMELMNNQITRQQGVHSPRHNFWSFALYFLAENISAPATALDFPSWRTFVRELRQGGYTDVGISFIHCNVMKARRMALHIRRHHPDIRIILGGYGTALPDLDTVVPHDAVCHGEGIRWLRAYLGEPVDRPIRHPVMGGVACKHIYGYRDAIDDSAVVFPGLGCKNGCFFCATSAKFNHEYIPFLRTGRDMFALCRRAEDTLGVNQFAVIDENFLKEPRRARELLRLMEAHGKAYNFAMFSSAEAIRSVGVDFLVRLGVVFVWVGVESRRLLFEKMQAVDPATLIRALQARGISVISSSILFLEHHDRAELEADIDWAVGLEADMHQFMQLTPLPGTPLYATYRAEGRLLPDFPYARMSGQDSLCFHHPHFASDAARELTRLAFRRQYESNGPGVLNMARTTLRGLQRARADLERRRAAGEQWNPETLRYEARGRAVDDPFFRLRIERLARRTREFEPMLPTARRFAPNRRVRAQAAAVEEAYRRQWGPPAFGTRLKSAYLSAAAGVEWLRHQAARLLGRECLIRQPPTRRIAYRHNGTTVPVQEEIPYEQHTPHPPAARRPAGGGRPRHVERVPLDAGREDPAARRVSRRA
jgi:hypothetical protein